VVVVIPNGVLRHRIDIEPHLGTNSKGTEVYGTKRRRVPAWVQASTRVLRTADGVDVTGNATALLRPGVSVPDQSRVTHGARTYTVLGTTPVNDAGGEHSQILVLDGPR
jgi:hypothetical protein